MPEFVWIVRKHIVIWTCGACGGVLRHKPDCPLRLDR